MLIPLISINRVLPKYLNQPLICLIESETDRLAESFADLICRQDLGRIENFIP